MINKSQKWTWTAKIKKAFLERIWWTSHMRSPTCLWEEETRNHFLTMKTVFGIKMSFQEFFLIDILELNSSWTSHLRHVKNTQFTNVFFPSLLLFRLQKKLWARLTRWCFPPCVQLGGVKPCWSPSIIWSCQAMKIWFSLVSIALCQRSTASLSVSHASGTY